MGFYHQFSELNLQKFTKLQIYRLSLYFRKQADL